MHQKSCGRSLSISWDERRVRHYLNMIVCEALSTTLFGINETEKLAFLRFLPYTIKLLREMEISNVLSFVTGRLGTEKLSSPLTSSTMFLYEILTEIFSVIV